jgi:hypothetical protein
MASLGDLKDGAWCDRRACMTASMRFVAGFCCTTAHLRGPAAVHFGGQGSRWKVTFSLLMIPCSSAGPDAHPAALQEALEARGTLEKLRARIRAEVFHAIEKKVRHEAHTRVTPATR